MRCLILTFFTVTILLFTGTSYSGTLTKAEISGLSPDGKYLSFHEYGTADGSGEPFDDYRIIDVDNNCYIGKSFKTDDTAYITLLKKYGINQKLKASLIYKSEESCQMSSLLYSYKFSYDNIDYHLILKEYNAPGTSDCDHDLSVDFKKMELFIEYGNHTRTLQKDVELPSSRRCVLAYGINSIYLFKNKIIIFLNYYTRGFEGPDINKMIVTGTIK